MAIRKTWVRLSIVVGALAGMFATFEARPGHDVGPGWGVSTAIAAPRSKPAPTDCKSMEVKLVATPAACKTWDVKVVKMKFTDALPPEGIRGPEGWEPFQVDMNYHLWFRRCAD